MSAGPSKEQWAEIRRGALETVPALLAAGGIALPALLLPYQQWPLDRLDRAETAVLVVEKSRRVGYTWALAAHAVLKASRARSARGCDVMYISYSQDMTREFVDACGMWARCFAVAAAEAEEYLFDDVDEANQADTKQIKAFRIRFSSGFEIIALSSAPRSLRGKQGLVIIDEAAFVESLRELLKAALAFLMWGGQVVVVSTHNGADNPFNELVQDVLAGRKPYLHHHVDFDEALQQGLYQRICLTTGKTWSPEAEAEWRDSIIKFYAEGADEELFCVPSQGSGVWLPAPLIEARMTADAPLIREELPPDFLHRNPLQRAVLWVPVLAKIAAAVKRFDPTKRHAFGFDFGRVGDLSVAWVLALDQRMNRETVLVVEMRRFPHTEQGLICKTIIGAMPRRIGAAFDAGGEGNGVAEAMQREFGIYVPDEPGAGLVEAIKLHEGWYRTEMPPLKAAFEDGTISIIKDSDHQQDLRLIQLVRGVPKVPDIRTGQAGKKRHADAAVALAMAYHATRMEGVAEYGYVPVPAPRSKFDVGPIDDDRRFEDVADARARPNRLASYRRGGIF